MTSSGIHWRRATHICVSKLPIIDSYNGLSPGRRQAIIWTNAGILLIGGLGTKFSEILIEIYTFSFKKMKFENVWTMAAILSGPQYVKDSKESQTYIHVDYMDSIYIMILDFPLYLLMLIVWTSWRYTAHKKFMNTSTCAESVASFILEGRYLESQTS